METLTEKINHLKLIKNAVILAHNYQRPDVQDCADFTGDSLGLSRKAAEIHDADVIVFCGVWFMAETAAILCPEKTVLIPEKESTCPMARMVDCEKLYRLQNENPDAVVVTYVNSTAEVKACSDICCTSANAIQVVNAVRSDTVIFAPDRHLADYVARHTDKKIIPAAGYCPTHMRITAEDIHRLKLRYPGAPVLVHPECQRDIIDAADVALSTSGMLSYALESTVDTLIIGTETGLLHRLRKENPDKTFIPAADRLVCPNMKRITLEKVLWALEQNQYEVTVNEQLRKEALLPIQRMLEMD